MFGLNPLKKGKKILFTFGFSMPVRILSWYVTFFNSVYLAKRKFGGRITYNIIPWQSKIRSFRFYCSQVFVIRLFLVFSALHYGWQVFYTVDDSAVNMEFEKTVEIFPQDTVEIFPRGSTVSWGNLSRCSMVCMFIHIDYIQNHHNLCFFNN